MVKRTQAERAGTGRTSIFNCAADFCVVASVIVVVREMNGKATFENSR